MKRPPFTTLPTDEDGGILVFWSFTLAAILGLAALVVDAGRLSATHSELQSYADAVSLTAAAELDGRADAIDRARAAASNLITDSQTFGSGSRTLAAADQTLTFYQPGGTGGFDRDAALVTNNPHLARIVEVRIAERQVSLPFSAAMAALSDTAAVDDTVAATAVAQFSIEACDVSPVAICLPSVDFSAETAIGSSLSLSTDISAGVTLPGDLIAVDTLSSLLDGLSICVGLSGGALDACLLAAQEPETACRGGSGGLQISADVTGNDLLDAVNTRFGLFEGLTSGLAGNSDFPVAPSLLGGVLGAGGLCTPQTTMPEDMALPVDDCFATGTCAVQGNGSWEIGRDAYIEAHYDGTDPFPEASTRFEFYQAEIAAGIGPEPSGNLVGNLLGTLLPQLCVPPTAADVTRRLMVVAGVNCDGASDGLLPPVQTFFEVFVLGPGENGLLNVEVTACLGGDCGGGNLDTSVQDIVRLVE
ncbi:pilus assembly protein TadG-related protein [Thalassococcus sp. BH17M4-6]|uniref:pilus assembly protein TadG-related protein n=1 Tax=Thalassococcus sp. BH17M4-6 TaxID=3413148 RepID=UPI003BD9B7CB